MKDNSNSNLIDPGSDRISRREMIQRASIAVAGSLAIPAAVNSLASRTAAIGEPQVELEPRYYPRKNFQPDLDLAGKLAVITGASRGNGRAVGEALAALGVNVIGTSRDPASVPNAPSFPLLPLDIADVGSALAFRAELMTHPLFVERGRVDILVNNAGRMVVGQIVPMPPTDFSYYLAQRDLAMRTLYSGHVMMTNLMLPLMSQSGYSRIMFTVSIGAYETGAGIPGASLLDVYFSSKAALRGYANNLDAAFRAGGSSIRVSTVNPYTMHTVLAEHPNPIYTQPVGPDGLSATDPVFNGGIALLRQLLENGLPTSMVGDAFSQLLRMNEPEQNVVVASPRKPFSLQGINDLNESAILAENDLSAIPFVCR